MPENYETPNEATLTAVRKLLKQKGFSDEKIEPKIKRFIRISEETGAHDVAYGEVAKG